MSVSYWFNFLVTGYCQRYCACVPALAMCSLALAWQSVGKISLHHQLAKPPYGRWKRLALCGKDLACETTSAVVDFVVRDLRPVNVVASGISPPMEVAEPRYMVPCCCTVTADCSSVWTSPVFVAFRQELFIWRRLTQTCYFVSESQHNLRRAVCVSPSLLNTVLWKPVTSPRNTRHSNGIAICGNSYIGKLSRLACIQ